MTSIRVNVGCGATPTAGWKNLDNSWTIRGVRNPLLRMLMTPLGALNGKEEYIAAIRNYDIRWADATKHLPFEESEVEVVYTSHMLEHMTRLEVHGFLIECLRVLEPGGILRVAVPDIDYHVGLYHEHRDADRFIEGLMMAGDRPRSWVAKVRHLIVGERHHLWMYNGASMSKAMIEVGFSDVSIKPAGETGISTPGALDLAERAPESVFVEAVKPLP
jgi:SAM-dependent methyltransferase